MSGVLTATSFQTAAGIASYCNNPTVLGTNRKSKVYQTAYDGNTLIAEYWFDAGVVFTLPANDLSGTIAVTAPPANIKFRKANGQMIKITQSGNAVV